MSTRQPLLIILIVASLALILTPIIVGIYMHLAPPVPHSCPMCGMMWAGQFLAPVGLLSLLAGVLIMALSIYYISIRQSRYGAESGLQVAGLLEIEKKALDLIVSKGRITQRDLARELGLSRVRAHRLVRQLEQRGLVESAPYGKTKILRSKRLRQDGSAEAQ